MVLGSENMFNKFSALDHRLDKYCMLREIKCIIWKVSDFLWGFPIVKESTNSNPLHIFKNAQNLLLDALPWCKALATPHHPPLHSGHAWEISSYNGPSILFVSQISSRELLLEEVRDELREDARLEEDILHPLRATLPGRSEGGRLGEWEERVGWG